MKSKYYSLTRFSLSHTFQIRKKFFIGTSLDNMSKFLRVLGFLHDPSIQLLHSEYLNASNGTAIVLNVTG